MRAKGLAGGTLQLTVSVPAAGGVKAVAKAAAGRPRKQRTLATASTRARGLTRTEVKLVLRPVERYRPELRRRGLIAGRAIVTYVAARGGRRASASRAIVFRQRVASSRGGGRK